MAVARELPRQGSILQMPPEVSLLLSSFNGGRYLPEQLDSLLAQNYPNLLIKVRDDGSSDDTRPILKSYEARYPNIRLNFGERLGIANSFFHLLRNNGDSSRYFAFCDQDDVWRPEKIERAVRKLSVVGSGIPALYCSRLEYVSQDLAHLKYSRRPARALAFQGALAENSATGCTMVLNRVARDMIVESIPRRCIMHDWWCYLVISAFGVVIYDDCPTVKYRLHASNDTGAAVSFSEDIFRRVRRFLHNREDAFRIHAQAQEFASIFGNRLPEEKRRLLARFLASKSSFMARIRFALYPGIHRQSRLDDLIFRALIVLGWY